MTIILGIIVPLILFLITLPLQSFLFVLRQSLKVKEIQLKLSSKGSKGSSKKNLDIPVKLPTLKSSGDKKKDTKLQQMSLKAMQVMIRALSSLVSFLRSVASTLMTTSVTALLITIVVVAVLIVSVSSIILFTSSEENSSGLTYGDVMTNVQGSITSSDKNIVSSSEFSGEWVEAIENMANWYIANINTYCTVVYPPNYPNVEVTTRAFYTCELLSSENKSVGDDCSSFAWACLAYFGAIPSPANAPSSGSYMSSTNQSKLATGGFTYYTMSSDTVLQAGDILCRSGHIEVVVKDNGDGTYGTFGWGTVRDSFPSTPNDTLANLISDYSGYYRLTK